MKSKLYVLLTLLLMLLVCGCQLALEEQDASQDRLIGGFVTFSREQNDLLLEQMNSREDSFRLYAELMEREIVDHETGEKMIVKEYVWPELSGARIIYLKEANEIGENVISLQLDPVIDAHLGIYADDESDRVAVDGTVYVSAAQGEIRFSVHPVYREASGKIYIEEVGSSMIVAGNQGEGGRSSLTIRENITLTEDGKEHSEILELTLTAHTMYPAESFVIHQYDENGVLLSSSSYEEKTVPEEVVADKKTDFLVLEMHKRDESGQPAISRSVYGREDNTMTFNILEDERVFRQHTVPVKWSEGR